MGVSLSTLLFRARLTHGYSALPTVGTCPVPWGHLFYLPKECYSRSQRWRCRHSSAAERKQKKGSKIILKVMLWRHGIGVTFWPKCWSRGALNNQSLSVCGIPGEAGEPWLKKYFTWGCSSVPGRKPVKHWDSRETRDQLLSVYCYTTKINFKKAPLHDEYCIVHFSDFFEGDRAFLVWKKWSILVKKWKPYVQKPNT